MRPSVRDACYTLRGFQLLLTLFKYCGVAPISVRISTSNNKKNGDSRTLIFSGSKWEIVYNVVLICCFAGCEVVHLAHIYKTSYCSEVVAIKIIQDILIGIALFSACTVILIISVRQRSALRISYGILDASRFLVSDDHVTTKSAFPPRVIIFSLLYVVLWIVLIISAKLIFKFEVFPWAIWIVLMFLMHMFFMQYVTVVMLIMGKFRTVNRVLSDLTKADQSRISTPLPQYILGTNPTVIKLKVLKSVHSDLCEICYEVERYYSLPILVGIGFLFSVTLSNCYAFVLLSLEPVPEQVFLIIAWLIFDITPLITLSSNITAIKNEAGAAGPIVLKLLSLELKDDVASELRQFSLQLLHHDLQFTGYGLFSIDLTLVHSIAGSIATYLVILFQLQPRNVESKKN